MSQKASQDRIPVILCIDVEPDEIFVDRHNPGPWTGFEFSHGYLDALRSKLQEVTDHSVNYYWSVRMDPQVAIAYGSPSWVVDQYPAVIEKLRAKGDEMGIHVHTYRWSNSRDGWLDDCGNPEWVSECLESSVDSYKRSFGQASRSIRFGNFWLSTKAVNQAEKLGLRYDLTVEPGLNSIKHGGGKPPQSGPTPDYYRVPREPYCPSEKDFRKPEADTGSRDILMIPLTSAYLKLGWGVKDIRCRVGRLRRNGMRGRLQNQPLSMWAKWEETNSYPAMLDRALAQQKRPYLAFAIRSDINGKDFPAYDACLNALLHHRLASRFVFCTPAEAMTYLR